MTDPFVELSDAEASPERVMAHVGVIDIGSNAIRLQVVRLLQDGAFSVVVDEREPIRLGAEVFRTGALSTEAMAQAIQTLARFSKIAQAHGAEEVRSVATSAMREATNGERFASEIEQTLGLKIEVISGEREARLIARGVLSDFGAPDRRVVLADIGGGSTEISVIDRGTHVFGASLPLGSARLTEMFCHSDPISREDEHRLRAYVRSEVESKIPSALSPCPILVGSAGTIGAVGNFIHRRVSSASSHKSARNQRGNQRFSFSFFELNSACTCLCAMNFRERRMTRGIEDKRAEIIVAGTLLLHELGRFFQIQTVRTVRRGLRDGLMLEALEKYGIEPSAPRAKAPPGSGKRRVR